MATPSARFERFVREFTRLADTHCGDEARMLDGGRPLLAALVAADDWLPPECAQPHPQFYRQYLLHADPRDRFSVVSFVWGPGQKTPVHNHTVWGLIGMLRGSELGERFAPAAAGEPMQSLGIGFLHPGDVEQVSPTLGDIHRVSNAYDDQVSISIHVYGGNIGRITRSAFDVDTGAARNFVSGYCNEPEFTS